MTKHVFQKEKGTSGPHGASQGKTGCEREKLATPPILIQLEARPIFLDSISPRAKNERNRLYRHACDMRCRRSCPSSRSRFRFSPGISVLGIISPLNGFQKTKAVTPYTQMTSNRWNKRYGRQGLSRPTISTRPLTPEAPTSCDFGSSNFFQRQV